MIYYIELMEYRYYLNSIINSSGIEYSTTYIGVHISLTPAMFEGDIPKELPRYVLNPLKCTKIPEILTASRVISV